MNCQSYSVTTAITLLLTLLLTGLPAATSAGTERVSAAVSHFSDGGSCFGTGWGWATARVARGSD